MTLFLTLLVLPKYFMKLLANSKVQVIFGGYNILYRYLSNFNFIPLQILLKGISNDYTHVYLWIIIFNHFHNFY